MTLGRESSPIKLLWKHTCGVMTAKKGCNSSSTIKLNTLFYVGFQPLFFLSYYLFEFDGFIFYFQEIYNSRLNERYEDNPSTHPDFNLDL
jgi:hypothetical protein